MKVSLEWLRDLVNIEQSADELAEVLTRGGIEVGGVESTNSNLSGIIIGEIISLEKHPNAEKLLLAEVNIGSEKLTLVTGAQNLLVGDKIPVARLGTTLPNGQLIEASKFRGITSEGMLCSAEELLLDSSVGLERSAGGILILSGEPKVGEELLKYLNIGGEVLDLELYPNRPDCLAMVNVAREVSFLTGANLNLPKWADLSEEIGLPLPQSVDIIIEEPELSFRYAGLIVEDVKIEPSPEWMQNRLKAAGVRPISNIVDITNYVMLEMGQPLHAFDLDKIKGSVHVRRAQKGEKIVTLDDLERQLDTDMLLITDDEQPLAIAGVMGGLDSEVTQQTKRLLIESAHFAGVSVRRTSRKLGLRSEASNRFEKGINPYGVVATLGRVIDLLKELGVGKPVALLDRCGNLPALRKIEMTAERTSKVLGMEISNQDIDFVLGRLNFKYEQLNGSYLIEIPSYRLDLQIEEDIIEEVARLIGYDRIPTTLPYGDQTQGRRTPEQEFRRRLRHLLVNLGMDEVITYSFTRFEADELWGNKAYSISLMNPLREELKVMRTSLMTGLLDVAERNVARRNLDVSIFEIGNVYLSEERPLTNLPEHVERVAGLIIGKSKRHWQNPQITFDFYYLKGILTEIAKEFGVKLEYSPMRNPNLLHPGRSAEVYLGGKLLGYMGELHPATGKERGLERALVFELDLGTLIENSVTAIRVKPIPRFPAVTRDLAVVVSQDVPVITIMNRIKDLGGELLQSVDIFDVYTGKPIPEGQKSLAFTLRYQSYERTLIDEEISNLTKGILEGIQKEFSAEFRR